MSTLTASHGLTLSERGLRLIKAFEGYRPVDRTLVNGQRVVGYGHKLYDEEPHKLSKKEADKLLKSDLRPYEDMINENIHAPLSQGQFDALVSFAFNIGPRAFLTSDTLHALNNGRYLDAANSLDVWRKSTINGKTYVIDALMRRRTAEKALFLRTDAQPHPAPTIDLPPKRDGIVSSVVDDTPILPEDFDGTPGRGEGPDDQGAYRLERPEVGIVEQPPIEKTLSPQAAGVDVSDADVPWREDVAQDDEPSEPISPTDFTEIDETDLLSKFDAGTESIPMDAEVIEPAPMPPADIVEITVETPVGTSGSSEIHALDEILELNELDELANLETDLDTDLRPQANDISARFIDEADEGETSEAPRSVIAEAAADISDRLDALIDNVREGDEVSNDAWPETLIQAESPEEAGQYGENTSFEQEEVVAQTLRSNDDVVLIAPTDFATETYVQEEIDTKPADLVIDNLAEDDAMRLHGDSPDPFASREMPKPVEKTSSALGLWAIMVLGLILLILAALTHYQGSERLLGEWGPLMVLAGALIGALMILGGLYYLIRRAFS